MRLRDTVVNTRGSTEFRRMLAEENLPLMSIGGGTAHHAQLAEATGFRLFSISGSQASAHILGLPDAGLMTMTEVVENTRRICKSVSIPVVADGETGFGNVVNTTRMVTELIDAGVAGFFIEDQVSPKRCGFTAGVEIVPASEAVGKFKAALAVRDALDPDVVVIARTDARAAVGGGLDEVLRRCDQYIRAGVDMLMVTALQSRKEIEILRKEFPDAKLELNLGKLDPPLSFEELQEYKVSVAVMPISKLAQTWMYDFLVDFKNQGYSVYNEFKQRHKDHPNKPIG